MRGGRAVLHFVDGTFDLVASTDAHGVPAKVELTLVTEKTKRIFGNNASLRRVKDNRAVQSMSVPVWAPMPERQCLEKATFLAGCNQHEPQNGLDGCDWCEADGQTSERGADPLGVGPYGRLRYYCAPTQG